MNTCAPWSLIVYGILLVIGGSIGFFKAGSKASLIAGGLTGLVGLGLGFAELQGMVGPVTGLVFGVLMAIFMGVRFVKSKKVMPSLPIAVLGLVVAGIHLAIVL